jgi:hypothetical protein
MKAPLLFFLALVLHSSSQAQSDSLSKKNEIGLNVNTLAAVFIGSSPENVPLGLTYKRVNGAYAWRAQAVFFPPSPTGFYPEERLLFSDSLTEISEVRSGSRQSLALRLGYEYRRKVRFGWLMNFGADLVYTYGSGYEDLSQFTYRVDSITGTNPLNRVVFRNLSSTATQYRESFYYNSMGMGLSIGLLIPLQKRLMLGIQARGDFQIQQRSSFVENHVTGTNEKFRSTQFDFSMGGPLTEISVYYRW